MIEVCDAQTIAAIASEFMTDARYAEWYERECDSRSGTPGIWSDIGSVGVKIIEAEKALKLDWHQYEFMEAIFAIVDRMYEVGLEQDWKAALAEILEDQRRSYD
jgi:hypothetical protein